MFHCGLHSLWKSIDRKNIDRMNKAVIRVKYLKHLVHTSEGLLNPSILFAFLNVLLNIAIVIKKHHHCSLKQVLH